jgi:hypothetical protein
MDSMVNWVLCSTALVLGAAATPQGRASERQDPNTPRVVTLVLQPAQLDAQGKKIVLLPSAADLKDGDAVGFYKKAVESLSAKWSPNESQEWRSLLSSKELPKDKVQAAVQRAQASLQLAAQGATSKTCNWTPGQSDLGDSFAAVRQLGILLCLRARLEISQRRYEDAIATIRTSLAMARHVGDSPTLIQSLVGGAMAEVTLARVADLAQAPSAPNLLAGLQALPQPLVDPEKAIASEGLALDDETAQRTRQIKIRQASTIASLQCIEALRHYAAMHKNQLPAELGDIADVQLPHDPVTAKPFSYRIEGSKAILETAPPKGGRPRDGVRYDITVAQ